MKFFNNLLFRVILAILLGIVIGSFANATFVGVFVTINSLFSQFLGFIIPLIIVGLIIPSIGNLGSQAGKMVGITALIAYGSTLFAGFLSYGTSMTFFPSLLQNQTLSQVAEEEAIKPFFEIAIPPFMDVMSALIFAFIVGIGLAKIHNSVLLQASLEFEKIINMIIEKVIIPFLPIFIFGIFLNMTHSGQAFVILNVFAKIIIVIFILHIVVLLIQFIIAGLIAGKNPFTSLKLMLPAYFTALGTQSSAATIPVTLKQVQKIGVSDSIAKLVVPLCATIHLSGSTLKIVACCIALMMIQGMPIDFFSFSGFILMLGVAMVAAPGVPGGAIMAAIGIIGTMLGFDAQNQALMIALYIAMDSFGTAGNVTGDGAIAIAMDKFFKEK
ncbi:dicarboxylate/amino acid:cation symporter [Paenimyroides tangerinum]|uniref:Dicarboxylate/amino acid:cation symporter n=1 Tax=Paenimyroides tangerinum TaxID=2488728 RepID=A0A3P3WCC6_9FLAO|nr:dicarboxylate/amino acid:cation symporter [Paenimyroides tangerinum]RRJ88938.1 dicarboxylate/amino acid:cation symporter [Paenimyroides tangerinum]RRJ92314.1 dicarboxylate/amino acid:cation symporter [Paenimyroides tangerinum]